MATAVMMKNSQNGMLKKGYFGFSWTYLFFGWWVPLLRGELGVAALHALFTALTLGIWQFIVCFMFNKQYTQRLLSQGFKFADTPLINNQAAAAIGVDPLIGAISGPSPNELLVSRLKQ